MSDTTYRTSGFDIDTPPVEYRYVVAVDGDVLAEHSAVEADVPAKLLAYKTAAGAEHALERVKEYDPELDAVVVDRVAP